MQKYLKLVDDVTRRMELANKFQCHLAVIDVSILEIGGYRPIAVVAMIMTIYPE